MLSNGYLTDSELKTIPWDRHFSVSVDIYANVLAFGEAFKARFGNYPAIESAYRPYAEQDYLYKLYGYPRSVPPGTSNHGLGRAIDWKSSIDAYGSLQWIFMNTEGRKFGFTPLNSNNLKFEPWHWQNLVSTVSNPGFNLPTIPVVPVVPPIVPITPIVPLVTIIEESPMQRQVIHNSATNTFAIIGPVGSGVRYVIPNQGIADVAIRLYGPPIEFVTRFDFDLAFELPVLGKN